jgi:hypothetical protein
LRMLTLSKLNTIYQLRIRLTDLQPPIWRRVEVEDCTLLKLHKDIQVSMGWENVRMWRFEIDGEEYGDTVMDEAFDREIINARKRKLSRFIEAGIKRFHYTYDLKDKWIHTIDIEETLKADPKVNYPRCVDGKRACPPESCGGPCGYEKFLDALTDPDIAEHEHGLAWMDDEFDSETFDLKAVNRKLARVR